MSTYPRLLPRYNALVEELNYFVGDSLTYILVLFSHFILHDLYLDVIVDPRYYIYNYSLQWIILNNVVFTS